MKIHGVWPVAVMGCLLWGAALAPAAEVAPTGATNDVAMCAPPVTPPPAAK